MTPTSPNIRPRQRARFADEFGAVPHIHVRRRSANEAYFRARNPTGWSHDLGAQDVFLDNLGIVVRQQIDGTVWGSNYLYTAGFMLRRWAVASTLIVQGEPWWGSHFNAEHRRAAGGEPRSLIRLLPEDWTRFTRVELEALGLWGSPRYNYTTMPTSDDISLFHNREYDEPWTEVERGGGTMLKDSDDWHRFDDWSRDGWSQLFDELYDPNLVVDEVGPAPEHLGFGALVPAAMQTSVSELRLLHPRHCTPDLPPRVGVTDDDRALYRHVLASRFQAELPTCVAHAVCVGLEVALRRARSRAQVQFSPAYLHIRTGESIAEGRWVRDAIGFLHDSGLPCVEASLPYAALRDREFDPHSDYVEQLELEIENLRDQLGCPITRELDVHDISAIKAHLAAGWVVIVGTRITEGFMERLRSRTIRDLGLLLTPLPGEAYHAGHAWCLVGYDHVDGATNWKYQGRFIALNCWGPHLGAASPHGAGTASIPFSFLLTEGIEAYALRFP